MESFKSLMERATTETTKIKSCKEMIRFFFSFLKLTQIDFVRRDMQFSVRQQLRQMEILEKKS